MIIIFIFLLRILGSPYFYYDSEGEALNIYNKKHEILGAKKITNKAEFPKRKLLSYSIKSFLFISRLEMHIESKKAKNGISKLRYDISFLSNKDRKNLNNSLKKVLKENKPAIKNKNISYE